MSEGQRITVTEWHKMTADGSGVLHRELLDGEPVTKAPMTAAHAECAVRIHDLIEAAVSDEALTQLHLPLLLDDWSEPRPDVSVMARPGEGHEGRPAPLLVVEIADSTQSLVYSRGRKAAYYARCAVPDCWIVDLLSGQLLAHSSPASGGYREIRNLKGDASVSLTSLPRVVLKASDILTSEDPDGDQVTRR